MFAQNDFQNIQYTNESKHQNYSNNNILNNNNTAFGENVSVKINHTENEIEKEICSILLSLDLKERSELLTMIYKYVDEHKKLQNI